MRIETLKDATFKVTMPCGKVFGGLYEDALIKHCQEWQQRQNELATMLAENGYSVESLSEYDYKVIDGKVFVFSHLYNDGFVLDIVTQKDLQQTAIAEELVVIAGCEDALKDVAITTIHHRAIERLQANILKDSEMLALIKQAIESGNKNFDDGFLVAWNERVESCKRGIKALNDKSGDIKCFYNRTYLVLNVLNDDVICVIE